MLRKIFKYEWKTIFPLLLGVHGVGLVIAILCRIGINLMGGVDGPDDSFMAILLLLAAIMAIGCVIAYTFFYPGYRFYKSVFTQQGYLTNTLPVTADQIIWGKGFPALIWMALDLLWALAAILILVASPKDMAEIFRDLPKALSSLFHPGAPAFARLTALSVLTSPFCMLIQIYASAAIGNLFTGHKLLATIVSYIGINFIQQILGLIILAFCAPHFSDLTYHIEKGENIYAYTPATHTLNTTLGLSLTFSILCAVGFYFLCRYVLNHKLNLE